MSVAKEEAGGSMPFAALVAMAMTGFVAIMTETLPAGLLPSIAADLHVSSAVAGQSVTAYAAGSLFATIPLTAMTQTLERRRLLLATIVGLLIFNAVTALAPSMVVVLGARFMAGVAAGVAWGMLAGFARRLVPNRLAGRALSIAMLGAPLALSFGVPAGTLLGGLVGWRGAFWTMSAATVALIGWVLMAIPRTPGQSAGHRPAIVDVLRRPGMVAIMLTVFAWMTAHNMLYTYIAPFASLSGMTHRVDALQLALGISALAGIWYTGARVDRMLRRLVLLSIALFLGAVTAMALMPQSWWIVATSVVLWGLSFGGAATQIQTAAADAAGDGVDLASAINATVWNGAIAAGGLIGGGVLQAGGPAMLPLAALAPVAIALVTAFRGRTHAFPPGPRIGRHS